MPVTLRPVSPDDQAFLFQVYATAREQELAQVPWTDVQRQAFLGMQLEAQQQDYAARFPDASHSIILVDGVSVGRIYVAEIDNAIKILDLTIMPKHRDQGTATFLIKELCARATAAKKPLQIYVENFSSSLRFFEKFGFSKAGESGFNILLQWSPSVNHEQLHEREQ